MIIEVILDGCSLEIGYGKIMQWCGTNILRKKRIVESFVKHFSGYKYQDYETSLSGNILINGEIAGRKYFDCIYIKDRDDLLKSIKLAKNSLLYNFLKDCLTDFQCQQSMNKIDEGLTEVFNHLKEKKLSGLDYIDFDYNQEELWEMVQKTSVCTPDGKKIESLDNNQLFITFLELLKKFQRENPDKRLILFDNIDHMLDIKSYRQFYEEANAISYENDISFVFCTSLEGYPIVDKKTIEAITVINDFEYVMPPYDKICEYLEDNYPCTINDNISISEAVEKIINRIGMIPNNIELSDYIILKLFNRTLDLKYAYKNIPNKSESAFLLDK